MKSCGNDICLLRCDTVSFGKYLPTVWRTAVPFRHQQLLAIRHSITSQKTWIFHLPQHCCKNVTHHRFFQGLEYKTVTKPYNGSRLLHLQHLNTMPCWQAPLQHYRENTSTDPLILSFGMSWRSEVSFMTQLLRPQWQNYRYLLGGPNSYSQCLEVKNLLT